MSVKSSNLITLFTLAALALASYACSSVRSIKSQSPNEIACQEWERRVEKLSPYLKEALARESVVSGDGGWIISRDIVSDCHLNLEIGAYFARVVYGSSRNNEADRQFARENSRKIVETLRRLWPTLDARKSSLRDGAFFEEKYNLLDDPALKEEDIAPFISELIDEGSVSMEFAAILLNHPMAATKGAVSRDLIWAEKNKDVPEEIYCLAVLQRMNERTVLPKLKRLSEERDLSSYERKLIPTLIAKIKHGEELKFSDVEDLDYLNDR